MLKHGGTPTNEPTMIKGWHGQFKRLIQQEFSLMDYVKDRWKKETIYAKDETTWCKD